MHVVSMFPVSIGVDLLDFLGGGTHGERRMWVGAEWGGVWGGVSPLQPTKGSGGASWAPTAGSGAERILVYFEGHRTLIFVPIWQNLGGQFALASPRSNFWGDLSPLSSPWSTPMPVSFSCSRTDPGTGTEHGFIKLSCSRRSCIRHRKCDNTSHH